MNDQAENFLLLAEDSWDLRAQFEILEQWLRDIDGELQGADSWIADIGFSPRPDASGGGPLVSHDLMNLCLRNGVEIFLSEYGASKGDA